MIFQANGSQSGYSNTQTKQNSSPKKVTSEKYVHKCPNCNETEWLDKSYPCIVYEDRTMCIST